MSGDKRFGVILSAKVDQYMAAMRQAQAATTAFSATTKSNLEKAGQTMSSVGKRMSIGVTLPLVGLGVAAIKASTTFEHSFSQMVGLAGIPAGEVDHLKGSIMSLSKETGVSAQELADALYFASSAGLDTSDSLDAVTVAAHASAVGMGSSQDVVGLVASALASYGSANLSAADAVDILTKTIKVGRAEPAELAGTLGRVLPIAAQLGVSFEEVGGATAYLSNVFGNTNRTVTALSGFMAKLVAPTQQGRDALQNMGTSAQELQATIKEKGLLGALELLRTKGFAGNQQALRALFDDVEAYQAALALLNDKSGTLTQTFAAVQDHAGALGDAFAQVADDSGFKMKQAFETMRVALIQAGDVIVPVVADIASGVARLADIFGSLPGPAQGIVLGFLGMAAAAGPMLMAIGSVIRNLQTLQTVASGLGPALLSMGPWILGIAAAAVVAYKIWDGFTHSTREAAARTSELVGPLRDATEATIAQAHAAEDAATAADGMALAHQALSTALTSTGDNGAKLVESLGAVGYQANNAADVLIRLRKDPVAALREIGIHAGMTADQAQRMAEKVHASEQPFWGVAEANQWLTENLKHSGKAMEELEDQAQKTNVEDLAQRQLDLATASGKTEAALVKQARAMEGANAPASAVYERFISLAAASDALAAEHDKAAGAGEKEAAALKAAGEAAAGAVAPADALTEAQQAQQQAAQAAVDTMMEYQRVLGSSDWGKAALQGASTAFGEYSQSLFAIGNFVQEKTTAFQGFYKAIGNGALNLDTATEAGRKQQDALEGVAKVLDTQLADAWSKAGGNMDVARWTMTEIANTSLAELANGAHLSADEVAALSQQLGLTPDQITTRMELAGAAEAQLKLQLLQGVIQGMPREIQMEIGQKIIEGDWAGAVKIGRDYMHEHPVDSNVKAIADGKAIAGAHDTVQKGAGGDYPATVITSEKGAAAVGKFIHSISGASYPALIKTSEKGSDSMGAHILSVARRFYGATITTNERGSDSMGAHILGVARRFYGATITTRESGADSAGSHIMGVARRFYGATVSVSDNAGSAQGHIDGIHGKTVFVDIVARKIGDFIGAASGIDNAPGGLMWVGERGAELMAVPRGASIYPHGESMAMASKLSGSMERVNSGAVAGPLTTTVNSGLHVDTIIAADTDEAFRKLDKKAWEQRMGGSR